MTLKGVRVNGVHERAGFVNGVGSPLVLLQACHGEPSAAELPNAQGEKDQSRPRLRILSGPLHLVLGCLWYSQHFHFHFSAGASQTRRRLPNPVARLARTHQRGPPPSVAADPSLLLPAARNITASLFFPDSRLQLAFLNSATSLSPFTIIPVSPSHNIFHNGCSRFL